MSARQGGAYAPPSLTLEVGHLLFLRDGTLMAQPLDAKRFELIGEPFPVAEHVGSYLSLGLFSVSANGVLVYRSGVDRGAPLAWFDRTGRPQESVTSPGLFNGGLALSPDRKRMAVTQTDQIAGNDIWIFDLARRVPTRFTFDPANDTLPIWSPDGRRIAFSSNRRGVFDIYQKDVSGSANEELLLKSNLPKRPLDWSPDGQYLLYEVGDVKTGRDLWVLTAGDRKPFPYLNTPFNERQGQFSPGPASGPRWIAYTSDESGQSQIYVQSFPAGAGKFQISAGGGNQPRWRRDGKELFYIAADGKLMAVEVKTAPTFEAGARRLFLRRGCLVVPTQATLFTTWRPTESGFCSTRSAPHQRVLRPSP